MLVSLHTLASSDRQSLSCDGEGGGEQVIKGPGWGKNSLMTLVSFLAQGAHTPPPQPILPSPYKWEPHGRGLVGPLKSRNGKGKICLKKVRAVYLPCDHFKCFVPFPVLGICPVPMLSHSAEAGRSRGG